jgi:acetate kinase
LPSGNGASITAIEGGKSIDTSMGLTPLEGLMMGTRCGDIDPAIPIHMQQSLGLSVDEVNNILNKKSGMLGLSHISNDMREIEEEILIRKNPKAIQAHDVLLSHQKVHRKLFCRAEWRRCDHLYRRRGRTHADPAGTGLPRSERFGHCAEQ